MDTDALADEEKTVQFHEMGLDDRILEAIAKQGWKEPTLIQEKAIPFVLEGKDVLARAKTGSGKTGAFVIPAIHKILEGKRTAVEQSVQVLILAPSRELCKQIKEHIAKLTMWCKREVRYIDVAPIAPIEAQRPLLVDKPDIVVGTPTRVLKHITAGNLTIKDSLKMLVIDEADLMFTFEYLGDIEAVFKHLPKIYQSFVTSATMSGNVKEYKKLALTKPVVLKLEEPPMPTATQLTHYVIKHETLDKAVMLFVLFRLNLIRGKTIVFVNTVDTGYKLRMFLSQFGIKACVLNSEMPVASRCHIVEQFNGGQYDIILASDELTLDDPSTRKNQPKKGKRKKDKESGVSRGIDFQFVSNVINFDFPRNTDSYIHRAGRTARGTNLGTVLSMVAVHEMVIYAQVEEKLKTLMPEMEGSVFKDFKFDMSQLEGFKYRAKDAWNRCTSIAILETRKKELKRELLQSEKLQTFFKDHPKDLQALRHDNPKHNLTPLKHLRDVPEYIMPQKLQRFSRFYKNKKDNQGTPKDRGTKAQKKYQKRKADPLKSMEFSGFKKKKT
ncbi:hypothetical protein Pmani_001687 [Petrolisthes manimaculis]|uniref:RNA helicase n=1 Tax=Petrolisthes manimaculis TaxID=1843537 RepID=A0AAE1QK44_9EUCA|nr:hypothetical protein Pmani_001687 [Petrolisthes manimaculis]